MQKLDLLRRQCQSATLYLERLRKSLPAALLSADESMQDALWWGCDVLDTTANGVVLSLVNPRHTSDEHQLRSPPFYVNGVPWTVRFYWTKNEGGAPQSVAVYLDANYALREDPAFEQQVGQPLAFPLFESGIWFSGHIGFGVEGGPRTTVGGFASMGREHGVEGARALVRWGRILAAANNE